ncbi:MAG: hypothetical protein ACREJ2_05910 [Planctomycetota bacterium]
MPVLRVPAEFFSAPEFPAECLYTGRTDRVERRVLRLTWQSAWDRTKMLLPVFQVLGAAHVVFLDLPVPMSSPQRLYRWMADSRFWFGVYLAQVLAVWGIAATIDLQPAAAANLVMGAFIAAAPIAWLGWLTGQRARVRIRLIDRQGNVELRFPRQHAARSARYKEAFDQYLRAGGEARSAGPDAVWARANALNAAWQTPESGPVPVLVGDGTGGLPEKVEPLVVTVDFMNSRFVPPVCLFSGRTDGVMRVFEFLQYAEFTGVKLRALVKIPQRPAARAVWNLQRHLWLAGALLGPLATLFAGLAVETLFGRSWMGFAGVTGLVATVVGSVWMYGFMRRRIVAFRLTDARGTLEIDFPSRLRAVRAALEAAWLEFREAARTGQLNLAPSEGAAKPPPAAAQEEFPDGDGGGSWDEAKGIAR